MTTRNRNGKTNEAALETFIRHRHDIACRLEALLALADDHFNVDPEAVNWGHVTPVADILLKVDAALAIADQLGS